MSMPRTSECPRCGYDLSGEIERWRDACPLEGVCSECGLTLQWREVLRDRLVRPRGFYEAATKRGTKSRWRWVTLAWALAPSVFWRRVGMASFGPVRLAVFWLVGVLLWLFVAASLTRAGHAMWILYADAGLLQPRLDRLERDLAYHLTLRPWTDPGRWIYYWRSRFEGDWIVLLDWPLCLVAGLVFSLGPIIVFLVSPTTRRVAKVRLAHGVRALAYGSAWLVLLALVWWIERLTLFVRDAAFPRTGFWRRHAFFETPMHEFCQQYALLTSLAVVAWQAWWWRVTVVRGWRLERGVAVWRAMVAVGLLLTILVLLQSRFIFGVFV
ncbi:MAG: hypothetical protein AAGK04_08390 [Planctomycetota bacterium]